MSAIYVSVSISTTQEVVASSYGRGQIINCFRDPYSGSLPITKSANREVAKWAETTSLTKSELRKKIKY